MHGGSRGEAPHCTHSVLLKDLQGPGAVTASRQHHLRLQSQCGNMFAGKQRVRDEEEEEEGRVGEAKLAVNLCYNSDQRPRNA